MLTMSDSATRANDVPHGPRRRRPRGMPALLAALAALAAGCSAAPAATQAAPAASTASTASTASAAPAAGQTGTGAAPAATAACKQPPAGSLPGSAGALTQDDSGVFCLAVGGRIDVFLTRPGTSGTTRWSGITTSDPKVLAPADGGMLTAPMGVTPGLFHAVSAGQSRLESRLPDGRTWQVTIQTLPG